MRIASPGPTSLRTELLVNFTLLTVAALALAVTSVVLLYGALDPSRGAAYLSALIVADMCIFVAFGAYLIQRILVRPLRDAMDAAEAVAAGDLHRRVPEQGPIELRNLAVSVNRMTERLLEERAQLVRVEKLASIGRLAAGVAHEIGNPLGAILGYSHVLRVRTESAGTAGVAEVLDGLERESARMDRIVRGLLDYAGRRSSASELVNVNDTLSGAVNLLRSQGVLRKLAIVLDLSIPQLTVRGERHELEQLFVNLILNAVDAMEPSGGARLTLHTARVPRSDLARPAVRREVGGSVDSPGAIAHPPSARAQLWLNEISEFEVVRVVVADSGPGIPPELHDRIFDPFFTTKDPGKGTGLGLAIASRIVDNLHGTIWVSDSREGGAAFHVLLPLAPAGEAGVVARGSLPSSASTPRVLQ